MLKNHQIKFIESLPGMKDYYLEPIPMSKIIPPWYKKQKTALGPEHVLDESGNPARSIKACMPVFDIINAGYAIRLVSDISIYEQDGEIKTHWSTDETSMISFHSRQQFDQFNLDTNIYHDIGFKFHNPWIIKTPPGYSCMFMHPTFRDDLPFVSLPAIVDTDKHPVPVNFPFLMRRDFAGVIEAGTPIIQIIPFKREKWTSSTEGYKEDLSWKKAKTKMKNRYKTFFRSEKQWR